MRSLLFVMALSLSLSGKARSASDLSEYNGTTYDEVRREIIREDWRASIKAEGDGCSTFPDWCEQRPEMHYCQLVGPIARCLYLWSKDDHILSIVTIVDGDVVESVSDSPGR